MKKMFALLLLITSCCANQIWNRIPMYDVYGYVKNFLDNRQINNCFYKFEDEDILLLKCWRDEQLIDVRIDIKERQRKRRFLKSLYI
tara:strand:- start:670 stop:930 length:261 start_codon:yes stop_codon:yes gene_type:complete